MSARTLAALVAVVEEAGGRISGVDGGSVLSGGGAVTTNGRLHDVVLERIG